MKSTVWSTAQFCIKVAENYCLITSWNYSKELHLHNEFSFSPKSTKDDDRVSRTASVYFSSMTMRTTHWENGDVQGNNVYNFWFFLNQHFISLSYLHIFSQSNKDASFDSLNKHTAFLLWKLLQASSGCLYCLLITIINLAYLVYFFL